LVLLVVITAANVQDREGARTEALIHIAMIRLMVRRLAT